MLTNVYVYYVCMLACLHLLDIAVDQHKYIAMKIMYFCKHSASDAVNLILIKYQAKNLDVIKR